MAHVVKVWLTAPSAGTAVCRTQRTAEELLGQERGFKDTPGSPSGTLSNSTGEGQLSQPRGACSRVPSKAPQWLSHTSLCSFSPSAHPTPCSPNTLLPQPCLSMQPLPALSMALSLANSPVTFKTELLYPLSQKAFL